MSGRPASTMRLTQTSKRLPAGSLSLSAKQPTARGSTGISSRCNVSVAVVQATRILEAEAALSAESAETTYSTTTVPERTEFLEGSSSCDEGPESLAMENVDVAVLGGDVAGLLLAYAVLVTHPRARVRVFSSDPIRKPLGGGGMVQHNGAAALRAIDPYLFERLIEDCSTGVKEAFVYDTTMQLVKQSSLLAPGAAPSKRRGVVPRNAPPPYDPNVPRMVDLEKLRRVLLDELPEGTVCYSHSITGFTPAERDGPCLIKLEASKAHRFAPAALHYQYDPSEGPKQPLFVTAGLVLGTDPVMAAPLMSTKFSTAAPPLATGRVLWRGTVKLRKVGEDPSRMRNFATAKRMFMDLSCAPGQERIATIAPAGTDTYVWSASCPVALMPSRGLTPPAPAGSVGSGSQGLHADADAEFTSASEAVPQWSASAVNLEGAVLATMQARAADAQSTAYARVQAMFEDFPQDVWTALKLTREGDVSEEKCMRAALADMGQASWVSTSTALAATAAHALPADDPLALGLALEDAAALGAALLKHGVCPAALAAYAEVRAERVRAVLLSPPGSLERHKVLEAVQFVQLERRTAVPDEAAASAVAAVQAPTLAMPTIAPVPPAAAAASVPTAAAVLEAVPSTTIVAFEQQQLAPARKTTQPPAAALPAAFTVIASGASGPSILLNTYLRYPPTIAALLGAKPAPVSTLAAAAGGLGTLPLLYAVNQGSGSGASAGVPGPGPTVGGRPSGGASRNAAASSINPATPGASMPPSAGFNVAAAAGSDAVPASAGAVVEAAASSSPEASRPSGAGGRDCGPSGNVHLPSQQVSAIVPSGNGISTTAESAAVQMVGRPSGGASRVANVAPPIWLRLGMTSSSALAAVTGVTHGSFMTDQMSGSTVAVACQPASDRSSVVGSVLPTLWTQLLTAASYSKGGDAADPAPAVAAAAATPAAAVATPDAAPAPGDSNPCSVKTSKSGSKGKAAKAAAAAAKQLQLAAKPKTKSSRKPAALTPAVPAALSPAPAATAAATAATAPATAKPAADAAPAAQAAAKPAKRVSEVPVRVVKPAPKASTIASMGSNASAPGAAAGNTHAGGAQQKGMARGQGKKRGYPGKTAAQVASHTAAVMATAAVCHLDNVSAFWKDLTC